MSTSLSEEAIREATLGLAEANAHFKRRFPGEATSRLPVHTVYGGAHLFRADTAKKLGATALKALDEHAPDAGVFGSVFGLREAQAKVVRERVAEKLRSEPVEDLRVDFEDGYGVRADAEEDGHAIAAAGEMAKGMREGTLPPLVGIRVKALDEEQRARSIRTLDVFMTALAGATGARAPEGFVVTLPKITVPEQVGALAALLETLEAKLGLSAGSIGIEVMIETPQVMDSLSALREQARGRCVAAHFGAYDYTAACGITAAQQALAHPACDFARHMMQVAYAGTGMRISDGATTLLPIGPHRGASLSAEQQAENRASVQRAWRVHHDNVRRAMENGFHQGWDLHPAQLVARYAAVHGFFLDVVEAAGARLSRFVREAARATQQGGVFDDAATGQGLLNVFLRAMSSGAITEDEATKMSSLTPAQLQSRSFAAIVKG
ncbi:MAG: aldolase/citrate lyase family protein [Minicystis sp.]